MSRQLARIEQRPQIRHRPFWTRLPPWVLMVALWVAVYVITVLAMKGF